MTSLSIENGALTITMEGADKFWALRSHLTLPLTHITSVVADPEVARGWWHGLRLGGTNLPGVILAGNFYQQGEWVFWDVHNPENTIVIETKDERYKKLIIEVDDPARAVFDITTAVNAYK